MNWLRPKIYPHAFLPLQNIYPLRNFFLYKNSIPKKYNPMKLYSYEKSTSTKFLSLQNFYSNEIYIPTKYLPINIFTCHHEEHSGRSSPETSLDSETLQIFREGGDNGLVITLIPKFLKLCFLINWLNNLGDL